VCRRDAPFDAVQLERADGLDQLGDAGPAIWQTTSGARISPPPAWSKSRLATITGVP
jgi:hypothetical protein